MGLGCWLLKLAEEALKGEGSGLRRRRLLNGLLGGSQRYERNVWVAKHWDLEGWGVDWEAVHSF